MHNISAQTLEASNEKKLNLADSSQEVEFEKEDYRALIGTKYVAKFAEFSDQLEQTESNLDQCKVAIESNKINLRRTKNKITKERIKEDLESLKMSSKRYAEQIKLIKKALRLLQSNKQGSDPTKLTTLNEVSEIESEILLLSNKYGEQKEKVKLDKLEVEESNSYMSPPKPDCSLSFNGTEGKTKKVRREIRKSFFFGYTHPKLKPYFKDKHFLVCEASLVQISNKNYLNLYVTIASKDAIKNYGYIEKNSQLKIELISGELIYLPNIQNAMGELESYTGNTKYLVTLPIDKSTMKQLSKSEVDKIGIMWSSGYEQYEILHVDLLMNQIDCLKSQ